MNLIIHTSNPLDDEVHYLIKLGNSNVQILKNILLGYYPTHEFQKKLNLFFEHLYLSFQSIYLPLQMRIGHKYQFYHLYL